MAARSQRLTGAVLIGLLALSSLAAACGARSSLLIPDGNGDGGSAGGGSDAGSDAPVDAPADVPIDVPEDVPEDVPPDAPVECSEPDETYIYLVTSQDQLYSFRPKTNTFASIGGLGCPAGGASPFSMAVSRDGIAHVVYNDGNLYRVDTADAFCEPTPFVVGQQGFNVFGMGYAPNLDDDGETMYVAEINFGQPSLGLASIDTDTYELTYIGPFSENPGNALELTPTGDNPLYGYFLNAGAPGGTLVQIDSATANIVESTPLSVGPQSSALAIAWWGGSFYIFVNNANNNGTDVHRYDPETQQVVVVASLGETVVGAGVSTCAPDGFE